MKKLRERKVELKREREGERQREFRGNINMWRKHGCFYLLIKLLIFRQKSLIVTLHNMNLFGIHSDY